MIYIIYRKKIIMEQIQNISQQDMKHHQNIILEYLVPQDQELLLNAPMDQKTKDMLLKNLMSILKKHTDPDTQRNGIDKKLILKSFDYFLKQDTVTQHLIENAFLIFDPNVQLISPNASTKLDFLKNYMEQENIGNMFVKNFQDMPFSNNNLGVYLDNCTSEQISQIVTQQIQINTSMTKYEDDRPKLIKTIKKLTNNFDTKVSIARLIGYTIRKINKITSISVQNQEYKKKAKQYQMHSVVYKNLLKEFEQK